MTDAAKKLVDDSMTLSTDERLEVASAILASIDGPVESGWDAAWAAEIDARERAARSQSDPPEEWVSVRERIAKRLLRTP
jgi:putative addiction module component (TIGR02574 family)